MNLLRQTKTVFLLGLNQEFKNQERFFSSLMFAVTILLLFTFVESQNHGTFVGPTFLTMLLSIQVFYARIFEHELLDRAFVLLKSYPVFGMAIYLAKFFLALMAGSLITVPVLALSLLFFAGEGEAPPVMMTLVVVFMSLIGLASLGVLLCALTLGAEGRGVLFPILYFPLAIPVLLTGSQAMLGLLEPQGSLPIEWMAMLACFDGIYLTLGCLCFEEVM